MNISKTVKFLILICTIKLSSIFGASQTIQPITSTLEQGNVANFVKQTIEPLINVLKNGSIEYGTRIEMEKRLMQEIFRKIGNDKYAPNVLSWMISRDGDLGKISQVDYGYLNHSLIYDMLFYCFSTTGLKIISIVDYIGSSIVFYAFIYQSYTTISSIMHLMRPNAADMLFAQKDNCKLNALHAAFICGRTPAEITDMLNFILANTYYDKTRMKIAIKEALYCSNNSGFTSLDYAKHIHPTTYHILESFIAKNEL